MSLPESPRVLYAKNQLHEVICQVRFPPILRIDSEVPAAFQERIRETLPLLSEEDVGLPAELPAEVSQLFRAAITAQTQRKTWRFTSESGGWAVALNRDFLALSTREYTRWEFFRQRLTMLLEALQSEYHPAFFTRLGLRYQNVIARVDLDLAGVAWSRLLKPHIAGEFNSPDVAGQIREATHRVLVTLPEGAGAFNLRHGTGTRDRDQEQVYLIDSDFFSEDKTEDVNVIDRLDSYNRLAARLFRWCISDELHNAMQPTAL